MSFAPAAAGARSILDAAAALFADEGFESVSVAAIATQAGVCKANVFHHFSSKEELYLAVMRIVSAQHADYAERLYDAPGSSTEKIRKLIAFEIRNMLENQQHTRLMRRENAEHGHPDVSKLVRSVFRRNLNAVVRIFEQGRDSGEFRADIDPAASAILIHGAARCFFDCREVLQEFDPNLGEDYPDIFAHRIATLLLSGVVAEPAPWVQGKAIERRKRRRPRVIAR